MVGHSKGKEWHKTLREIGKLLGLNWEEDCEHRVEEIPREVIDKTQTF